MQGCKLGSKSGVHDRLAWHIHSKNHSIEAATTGTTYLRNTLAGVPVQWCSIPSSAAAAVAFPSPSVSSVVLPSMLVLPFFDLLIFRVLCFS